jgi:hypothetical protein
MQDSLVQLKFRETEPQSEDTNYNFGVSHAVWVFGMIYRIAERQ